jgi:hypothetical protein
LRAGQPRIVVGLGEHSAGQTLDRIDLSLAERLGTQPVHFPGDHGGYGAHPDTFAETLHRAFSIRG